MKLQIALKSARGRSRTLTAERLVNMFAEAAPDGSEGPAVTHGVPGMSTFATCGTGPTRGMRKMGSLLYVVSGAQLFSVTSAGIVTYIGIVPGTAIVSMADDGDILVIVTDPDAYTYTASTNTFAKVTDANYAGAHSVTWMNQTFIFANATEHFIGATGGLLPFDPLMAASAEYAPDNIVGIARDHNELLVFGETTLESWQSIQTTDATEYPFDAITGATGEKGLASRSAIAQLDNTSVWLDQHGIVRRLAAGYVPQRISTEAIEHQIAQGDITTATMLVYVVEGHECFALSTNVGTWVYDANTTLWHERSSYGLDRWKGQCSAYCWGAWYVGSSVDGTISSLSLDVNDENGDPLIASMVFPNIVLERARFTTSQVELGCDVGAGSLTTSPLITLYTSRDGGTTWSNGSQVEMGLTGDYARRVIWRRVGQTDKLTLRFDISDGYKRCVYAAYADIERDE